MIVMITIQGIKVVFYFGGPPKMIAGNIESGFYFSGTGYSTFPERDIK
jgi:hypothetical protein